jgi:hypothetical protein
MVLIWLHVLCESVFTSVWYIFFIYSFPYCNSFGTSQGHYSPLTRGKAKSSSVSTPESLKLRRTRSGRVVVPTLDPGCQRIVYDRDGLVSGVAGLEFESPPLKGNESRTPESKRRVRWATSIACASIISSLKMWAPFCIFDDLSGIRSV